MIKGLKRAASYLLLIGIAIMGGQASMASSSAAFPGDLFPKTSDSDYLECRAMAKANLARQIARFSNDDSGGVATRLPFGAHSLEELRTATIGLGFEVFTISPAILKLRLPLEQHVEPTGTWHFAVMAGQRPMALLTLARISGRWCVVETRDGKLAETLDAIASRHAAQGAESIRFIRMPLVDHDLVQVQYPATHVHYELLSAPGKLLHDDEVLNLFSPAPRPSESAPLE
jgi:hypothetical protein